jgi:O-6-methylguanine DNA methyltransferase
MSAAEFDGKLVLLEFCGHEGIGRRLAPLERSFETNSSAGETPVLDNAIRQLREYFDGRRKKFDIPIRLAGTLFQQQVWNGLLKIPYGQTESYGSLAERLGKPSASRAVGHANGQNPISIIVPCHRVIGKDGSLTGYGGELWRKKWLLEHEGALTASVDLGAG